MRTRLKLILAALMPALALLGCTDFLTGAKLTSNPNRPTAASASQLFVGSEVATMAQWETYPFNLFPLWIQQIAGVQRQWANYAQYRSGTDEFTADGAWNTTYGQGGYSDLLNAVTQAGTDNNLVLRGQARVLSALLIGTAADIWGNIPFSDAGTSNAPTFDAQSDVYAHVEALLDSAIADLQSGQGAGSGGDFFFGDDPAKWVAAAHTLKARYFMHQSRGSDSLAMFSAAAKEAADGIQTPDGDLQTSHTSTFGEQNLFYQFLIGPRAGDVEPSQIHMNVLKATGNSALLPVFYVANTNGQFVGSVAGQSAGTTVSTFAMGPTTPVGIVTFVENQMILAETQYRAGNAAAAKTTLNAYRASVGAPNEPDSLTVGGKLLVAIVEEKFARELLNPEVYFDYLRTCVPNVPMPADHSSSFDWVPARLPYGYTETITNPNLPQTQPNANANFPALAKDPTGAACVGQMDRAP